MNRNAGRLSAGRGTKLEGRRQQKTHGGECGAERFRSGCRDGVRRRELITKDTAGRIAKAGIEDDVIGHAEQGNGIQGVGDCLRGVEV